MEYFNEDAILNHQIQNGSDKLIAKSATTSQGEPELAIGQLLLAAACLAKTIEMTPNDFLEGVRWAMKEVYPSSVN